MGDARAVGGARAAGGARAGRLQAVTLNSLLKAGATEVLVVGATHQFPDSVQARADGVPNLPLHDGTVDLVVLGTRALEGSEETLQALLLDLRRVLAPEGRVIAAVQMPGARVFEFELPDVMGPDFWTHTSLSRFGTTSRWYETC